ncbi:peptidoglycan-binding domain-containing protein [Pseudonocardia sp.]|uniref:peptidoglycan-binding domain-containing protein n=1 Tax=Pseudonocardia sp. TaxID=60912 RepID=UPI003D13539B
MNTTTTTPATTTAPGARHTAPTTSRRAKGLMVGAVAAVGIAAAGVITTLVMTVSGAGAQPAPAPSISHATGYVPADHKVEPVTPVTPAKPVTPVAPSAAIETLQKELGRLNYYEGPVTGVMNTQTTQAITYLQRDADLPRTGTMNAATQAALDSFLVNGNNHMGG